MTAAENGDLGQVKSLIAAGADVHAKADSSYTAFMWAAERGNVDCLQALIAAGADVNAEWKGDTALIIVAKQGNADCLQALIAAGAEVNGKDYNGLTALMLAADKNHADCVKALIAAGAVDRFFECSRPPGDGICADNDCPCGWPGATLPRGTGYLYISKEVVDFRDDARTEAEAMAKIASIQKRSGLIIANPNSLASAILICKQAALKRGIDLEIASQDAKHWWETGEVPLRPTPILASG
jgi:hypothetical protein